MFPLRNIARSISASAIPVTQANQRLLTPRHRRLSSCRDELDERLAGFFALQSGHGETAPSVAAVGAGAPARTGMRSPRALRDNRRLLP
jgi:hypothetical protein